MAGTRRLLAMMISFSLAPVPGAGKRDALGMVAQAEHASLGEAAASAGTTIFEGDRLATGEGGSLSLLVGTAVGTTMLYLREKSCVIVRSETRKEGKALEAELLTGAAVLSVSTELDGQLLVNLATVRPLATKRGVVEVRRVGPKELIVYAKSGAAEIAYRGETEAVAEGKAYRVKLNDEDDAAAAPKEPWRRRRTLEIIAVATVAVGVVIWLLLKEGREVESPERP